MRHPKDIYLEQVSNIGWQMPTFLILCSDFIEIANLFNIINVGYIFHLEGNMKNLRKLLIVVTSLFCLTFCSGEVDSSPIDNKESKTAEQEPIINVITPETIGENNSETREDLEENDQDPVNDDNKIDAESNAETSTSKETDKFDPTTFCDRLEKQSWDAVSIFSTLNYHFRLSFPEGSKYIFDLNDDIEDVNDAVLKNLKGYQGFEEITGVSPS